MKFVPAGTEYNFRQFFDNVVGQDVDYTKKGFDSFLTAIASAKLLMKEKRENSEKGLLVPSGVGTILACYHKEPKPASKEEEEKDNPVEIVWDRSKFDKKKGRDR